MVKKISKNNLPDKEVLAFNGEEMLLGNLGKDPNGIIYCDGGESYSIENCTHYISSIDLIKMFKDSKEQS